MSMSKRIASIVAELERLKLEEAAPVDDLSRSLFSLGEELARLDTLEKAALLTEFNQGAPPGRDRQSRFEYGSIRAIYSRLRRVSA